MRIPRSLILVFLALLASGECRRSGYRLPKIQGRSATASPSPQDVGSGRDLMKKFMMMRGLFQQPSDNIIVISNPTTASTTTTTTPGTSPTTTTTTTTTTNSTTGRAFDGNAQVPEAMTVLTGLEDRLDLPEAEPLVVVSPEAETHRPRLQKRFRVKNLKQLKQRAKKTPPRRRVHRHHKKKRGEKKTRKSAASSAVVNQQRNSEASTVNFIEPYHNDRPQRQPSQSGSDSRLQRIWRRFQMAN